jgi:hypothetical protein
MSSTTRNLRDRAICAWWVEATTAQADLKFVVSNYQRSQQIGRAKNGVALSLRLSAGSERSGFYPGGESSAGRDIGQPVARHS